MVLCPPPVISASRRTSAGYLSVSLYLAENTLRKGQQHEKYSAQITVYVCEWRINGIFVVVQS